MAYISDWVNKEENAAVTTHTVNMPVHAANDLLIVLGSKDGTGTMTCGTSGWAQVGATQSSNGANVSAVFWKLAVSSAETAPTLSTGTGDGWVSLTLCISDVDTGTPIDNSTLSSNAAASQFAQAAVTPATVDCLILYLLGVDGTSSSMLSNPGTHFIISFDNAGTTYGACAAAAWYVQRAIAASPTCGWTGSLSSATNRFTIAIRNKSGGRIPAYIDDIISPGMVITPGHHFSALNGISFAASLSLATIGGKTTVFDAAAATADYGINPYSAALVSTPAATVAANMSGFQIDFGSSKNMSTGLVMGNIIAANPKMANYYHGTIAQGGTLVTFADASNNYIAYQVASVNSIPNTGKRIVWCIQPSQSATAFGTSGTLANNAVTKMLLTSNCPLATISLYSAEWHQIGTIVVAGGDATTPVDSEAIASIGSSFRLEIIQRTGAASLLSYAPIQIGGGDAVNFQIDAGALQFPRIYSTTKKEIAYHAAVKKVGISYAGKSGDTIKHTNSVVTSPSEYYWEINSAATNAATWDFNGLTIVGAYVTLRNVMTFTGMTFSSCTNIDATGCTVDGCTISRVPSTNDSLTVTAASNIDNCSINVTTVSSGNRLCSTADPSVFTGNTFTGSTSTGHVIRITTQGEYNLVGNTFTSFGANESNSAAILNDSSGAVILNISGGGNTPTIKNGASANTTVNNNIVLTLTGLITGSDIEILNAGTITERVNVQENVGTIYEYQFAATDAGVSVDIGIFKAGYIPKYVRAYTLPASDGSLPISQTIDRDYLE